jgi:DNA polymerase-1
MSSILVVDTYSLFFRSFHALPAMCTSQGEPTNAVYGVSVLLLKLLRERQPRGLAFALDAPARTFRHESYGAYKASRPRMPSDLALQLGRLDELLEASGAPVFCVPGFEADDVIATLCAQLTETAIVVSGDRDLLQLAAEGTEILFIGARGKQPQLYTAETVSERFGVPPDRLPSFTALVGDTSDNLPGVPGIGPGTASKLLRQYSSVSELLANLERVGTARTREALRAHATQMQEVERLARLHTEVPLGDSPLYAPVDKAALGRLRQLFETLEFRSLLERLARLEAAA